MLSEASDTTNFVFNPTDFYTQNVFRQVWRQHHYIQNKVVPKNVTIEEPLGEQNLSKGDSKIIKEKNEKYITSTKHEF